MIVNGRSTDDLPFFCVVETNDAPKKSEKKDDVFETDYADGYAVQKIDAYSGNERVYNFYLHEVTNKEIRQFKTFVPDEGWFTPSDDDLKFYFVKSLLEFEPLDSVNGYVCVVTFFCQPFGMEEETGTIIGNDAMTVVGIEWDKSSSSTAEHVYYLQSASQIINHTNAPMYPLVEIRGATGNETFLQIGEQRMTFKEIQDVIYIECKPRFQDVWSSGGRKINNEVSGPFFEIQPGENPILKGEGINFIKITERWGWR